ncbi:B12-binding domain-containing radical SAM protein [Anditalea andensis]|uniref:Fe-S oxidoreductase n=1 Tax=Anditalea andensis TaxID=1048983 RepID=A0A074L0G8_9BACT|nr:radical SAM protein [Anditalea andensis]KEO73980.1 Fe-S oxidoreductase [Anditalea andensis]
MNQHILLLTPPFTQLNTPYPATAYLKGFINSLELSSDQADLGIEIILHLFSRKGLISLFESIGSQSNTKLSKNSQRIIKLQKDYLNTIDAVIKFLQYRNPTLAYNICDEDFLPQARRFEQLEDLDWAFGTMGIQDRARHLATLYLEDLSDLIQEAVDSHFGFSRYAERLGRSATDFEPLYQALEAAPSYIDHILFKLLAPKLENVTIVCLTVPFPGNLYGALRCGKYIKENQPHIKVIMGGGYPNTELRSLKEPRIFKYIDYITLDDGEKPLMNLFDHLDGKLPKGSLKRTFYLEGGEVVYQRGIHQDIPFSKVGTPDYTGLPIQDYLSVIEIVNPMHRLWSDGRWNKLTMAHGCYWKKCTFCDISLDYIKNYEPISASLICDRIEELISQTKQTGFHFVDEAAPPALMRELAIELLRRDLKITWWTNIRFEERFTYDLCRLLKASGCIAVSGGLEVASDRLLHLMQKGVTVAQVARVAHNFTQSGIMVHAYLMYGFPTQSAEETIDSLEMVRQLFYNNVLQSAFWHLFAMTAHSPVGMAPEKFGVTKSGPVQGLFADNDLIHDDPEGTEHEWFSDGLKKALFNYMHGIGFEYDLQEWFDFEVPKTSVKKNFIENAILNEPAAKVKESTKLIWLGNAPEFISQGKKSDKILLYIENKSTSIEIKFTKNLLPFIKWLFVEKLENKSNNLTMIQIKEKYELLGFNDFEAFLQTSLWIRLKHEGLLMV